MQYYTKQQLQGAGAYGPRCRIGNWDEDLMAEETQFKDFLRAKEMGELKIDKFNRRTSAALQKVELVQAESDEYVHFGDVLQVRSCAADVALSCECIDIDSNITPDLRHDVTASGIVQPCMRNTFIIKKYLPKKPNVYDKEIDGNTLHYGQKFYLIANPGLLGDASSDYSDPLYIQSEQVSTTSFACMTREQTIYLSQINSYGGVWEILTPDPMKRPASQFLPVLAGVPVIIRHCGTRKNLNCESATVRNDLGSEFEVTAHTVVSTTAQCGLEATKNGAPESTVEKMPLKQNVWRLVNKIETDGEEATD